MRTAAILCAVVVACGGGGGPPKPAAPAPVAPKPAPAPPAAPPPAASSTSELTGPITAIRIEGTTDAAVPAAFAAAKGKPLDPDLLRDAARAVMRQPGVAHVTLQGVQRAGGIELVVQVAMYPVLRKLTAVEAGGKPIALGISAAPLNTPLEPLRIQTLASSLRDRYLGAGHLAATATWRQVPVAGGIEVVIEVTPGPTSTITSLAFRGATVPAKTLAAQVAQWLVVGQPLVADKLERATLALQHYYFDHGYVNIRVTAPAPAAGRNAVVFAIDEGPQFRIGNIKIRGLPAADHARYRQVFGVKPGEIFSRTAITQGRQRVVDALVASGKPAADVAPITMVDTRGRKITLTLEVSGVD